MEKLINKLKEFDYDVIETYKINEYTLFLLYDKNELVYEIFMTSKNRDFTTAQLQSKIITDVNCKISLETSKLFINKIKEWLAEYYVLYLDSLNENKAHKYHNILKKLGLNVTNVEHNPPNKYFPEYWDFKIHI
jgi:hypothetical protein